MLAPKKVEIKSNFQEVKQKEEENKTDTQNEKKMLEKKTARSYDLVDDELKKITLDNDLVAKLISNNKGLFVDFRKYYKGYPTKKGIRILATKFREVAKIMDPVIKKVVPNIQDLEELNEL